MSTRSTRRPPGLTCTGTRCRGNRSPACGTPGRREPRWPGSMRPAVVSGCASGRLAPLLPGVGRLWGHGDWHPSNLTWDSASPDAGVAAVIDLGLANRTFAAHDLAVAIERSAVPWLDLNGTGRAGVDGPAVDALLDGYQAVRPLTRAELATVGGLLPVVHLEYALSE